MRKMQRFVIDRKYDGNCRGIACDSIICDESPPSGVHVADGAIYVDASVAISGDGISPATAFRTVNEAYTVARDGDTINVMPGIYTEDVHIDLNASTSQRTAYKN